MSDTHWSPAAADVAAVKAWLDEWGAHIADVDYDGARPMFHDDVIGYGTMLDFMEGLDALATKQWRSIWPTIEDFHHETEDSLRVSVSPDRLMALALVLWSSKGFDENGASYDRPGRTTAVLVRPSLDQPFRAIHTHVSLFRGMPQRSFGQRAK